MLQKNQTPAERAQMKDIFLACWDFMDKDQTAERREYKDYEQDMLFESFMEKLTAPAPEKHPWRLAQWDFKNCRWVVEPDEGDTTPGDPLRKEINLSCERLCQVFLIAGAIVAIIAAVWAAMRAIFPR